MTLKNSIFARKKGMERAIKFKFEGQNHCIDANTVINSLIHYQNIITIINNELGEGDYKIKMQVNAFEQGSFVIDVSLISNFIEKIFNSENLQHLTNLVAIFGVIFTVYQTRKGKPIKNKKDLPDIDINIDKVIKIYNNQTLRESISKTIETADDDVAVEGIVIESEEKEIIKFDKEEFKDLIYTDFADEVTDVKEKRNIIVQDAILNIITLSFEHSSFWKVLYRGNKIKLPLKDETLIKLIDNGAKFGKGDCLKVDLEITQKFNYEANAYENMSYRIAKFKEHIQRLQQTEITI